MATFRMHRIHEDGRIILETINEGEIVNAFTGILERNFGWQNGVT